MDTSQKTFVMVEQGAKFGVILARLRTRYDAEDWADIKIGDIQSICSEAKAGFVNTFLAEDKVIHLFLKKLILFLSMKRLKI